MRFKHLILLILLPIFTLACALGELAANTGGQDAESTQVLGPPPAAQPGDLRLDAAASGLQAFSTRFQANFNGQDGQGNLNQSGLMLSEAYDASKPVHYLLAKTETSGQLPASLEIYEIDGMVYLVSTEVSSQSGCMQLTAETPSQSILQPEDVFLSLKKGELVQQGETLNGVLADHYKLASMSLGVGQVDSWDGDIWVAQQGDYVLQFTGWADGQFALTGQPGQGRLEWSYVLDSASPVSVVLPEDCRGMNLSDVVLPPGAENIKQRSSQITFTSPAPAAELVDFFHTSLPENGWAIENESGTGELTAIVATKDNRSLQILVEESGQTSQVTISLR